MPIGARFHGIRDRIMAAVDHRFAERVRLAFMRDGKADPDRQPIEIEAPLRVGGGKETTAAGAWDKSWRGRITSQRSELHIDPIKYPGIIFRKGDRVRALARPGQPWFGVLAVDDRGETRQIVQLEEL
ncbi:MAG: hypothetical protein ACT6QU_02170 [Aliihoeflea sp.]|uniref:hypothetical protein n=1 Tax=Aliihoeflea sp. TaxID=2608088 RepID=UPI0040349358